MLQDGIGNTPPCKNQSGDTEYEISALPYALVRSLYVAFVGSLPNKRPRRAMAEQMMMDYSDSD